MIIIIQIAVKKANAIDSVTLKKSNDDNSMTNFDKTAPILDIPNTFEHTDEFEMVSQIALFVICLEQLK